MKTLLLSFLTLLLPFAALADGVEIDGIYYNIISKKVGAEVTSNPSKYSGSVNIPASITYDGVEYRVTSIQSRTFYYCSSLTSVTIPNSVTSIGSYAFYDCSSLTSISIPNSVTMIEEYTFCSCSSLISVTIPSSVTSIGNYAFYNCSSLTSVSIPNSVTSIGDWSFGYCSSLNSATIPNSVTSINNGTFGYCSSLISVSIPNSVTSIGEYAFADCNSLTSVTIPNSVTSIGSNAFCICSSLTSVTIPNSVTSIGINAFGYCHSLTSVTIPNSVTWIESSAFEGCSSLPSVTIPSSVTSIGREAFSGCSNLTSVTIGSSVSYISSKAFASCPELIDVYCLAENVPSTASDAFLDSYIDYSTLHVLAGSIDAYKSKAPWKNFKSIVALDGSETPETPKCTTPTISYQNGHLIFESETEGVEFVTDITDNDIKRHYDSKISLTATYNITVYATKSGYDNSDVATATLCWIDQQPETEGIADGLAQIPSRPVLIKTDSRVITVEGVDDQTNITLFTSDGKLAGSAISLNGSATIDTHLPSGTTAIVRIGEKSVKVVL